MQYYNINFGQRINRQPPKSSELISRLVSGRSTRDKTRVLGYWEPPGRTPLLGLRERLPVGQWPPPALQLGAYEFHNSIIGRVGRLPCLTHLNGDGLSMLVGTPGATAGARHVSKNLMASRWAVELA
jgi:hypothetical protein